MPHSVEQEAQQAPRSNAARQRMPDLDGLRAIAILLVLFDHFVSPCFPVAAVRHIASFGWCGVDLFFVLSGFLIGGILLDHRSSINYYQVFYLRRFFRIVPLYLVMLVPLFVIVLAGMQGRFGTHRLANAGWWTILIYLTFQQNIFHAFGGVLGFLGPTWSLAIEEKFYLLLPPLVRNCSRASLVKILVGAALLAPVFRALMFLTVPDASLAAGLDGLLLPCRWDALLPGTLLACAFRSERFVLWLPARLPILRLIWAGLGLGMLALDWLDPSFESHRSRIFGYSWIAAFFACSLLLSRASENGLFRRFLGHPFWKPLATVSYGLYLWQGPTMALRESALDRTGFAHFSWGAVGVYAIFLVLTVVLTMASWRLLEKPILDRSHRHRFAS